MFKVALPTDFSENSKNAIIYALHFYAGKNVIFHLLHSHVTPKFTPEYFVEAPRQTGPEDLYQKKSLERLKKLEETLRREVDCKKYTFILDASSSSLKQALSDLVTEENLDIIVMGTQGTSGAKAVFLGTTTTKALKYAICPVLVIPNTYTFKKPLNVSFTTDFKRNFSADILRPLQFIISMFRPSLRIMHINEEKRLNSIQQSNRNTLETYMSKAEPTWHWMPYFSTKTASINLFIEELEIDMLAMVRYEHNFFEKLLREPVIKKMSFCIEIPFLVIPFRD